MPLALGVLSVIGLFAALLADGGGDLISWVALTIPVGVVIWKLVAPSQSHVSPRERVKTLR